MPEQREILVLNRSEVRQTLEWDSLIMVVRSALIGLASPEVPDSISAQLVTPDASLHVKAGGTAELSILALKANLRPHSGDSDGAVLVFDAVQQNLRAVLASGDLTAFRTAAIAATAAEALVTVDHPVVALVGAGPVAQRVDEALAHLGLGAELRVWSRSLERAQRLVDAGGEPARRRACASVPEATRNAHLVVTCTPARSPLLDGGDVAPHATVLAMGADSPGKRELGDGLLEGATLFADVPSDAVLVGESRQLPPSEVDRVGSLGALLADGRGRHSQARTIVDSVGSSAVDAAVSAMVVSRAVDARSGTWLGF